MEKIGLFYGSDTGYTEDIAARIKKMWGDDQIELHDIRDAEVADLMQYERLIIGTSTWNDGELVSGWYDFYGKLDGVDFAGKTVALFGLGDQISYGEWYNDAMGILGCKIRGKGATLIGSWPTDGYHFASSKAVESGRFIGLAIDEINQPKETHRRLEQWIAVVRGEFSAHRSVAFN